MRVSHLKKKRKKEKKKKRKKEKKKKRKKEKKKKRKKEKKKKKIKKDAESLNVDVLPFLLIIGGKKTEAVFLFMCDPSMNEL